MSFGVTSLSLATIRMRPGSTPSTSVTHCTRTVEDPCPISGAPVRITTDPSKSSLMCTVACGSPVQWTGFDAPLT